MKYKAIIKNEVTNKEYSASFDSISERDEYVNRVINKKVLGLQQREILKANLKPELADRVIAESIKEVTITKFDEEGNEVEEVEQLEYVTVKSDFVVTLSEENNYVELRSAEYPSIQEIIHILMDHGMDSAEMQALKDKRISIKNKYPKE